MASQIQVIPMPTNYPFCERQSGRGSLELISTMNTPGTTPTLTTDLALCLSI